MIAPNFRRPVAIDWRDDVDRCMVQLHIRENDAGTQVGLVAEDGIADVAEMRHLRLVENQAVLELARVSRHLRCR